jgi:hypothetical protein
MNDTILKAVLRQSNQEAIESEHATLIGYIRNEYRISVVKPDGKISCKT